MDITMKKVSRSIPSYLLLWYIVLFTLPLCASWELKPIVVGAETFTEFDKHLGKKLVFAECDGRLAVIDNANNRILFYALNGSIQDLTFLADFGTFAQPNPIVPYVPFNPTTNNRVDSNVHGAFFRDTLWVRNRLEGGANSGSDILRFTKDGEFIDRIGNPAGVRYLYESGERLFGVDGQKIWQWNPESSAFEQVFTVPSNSGVSFSDSSFAIRKGYTTLQVFRLLECLNAEILPEPFLACTSSSIQRFAVTDSVLVWGEGSGSAGRWLSLVEIGQGGSINFGGYTNYLQTINDRLYTIGHSYVGRYTAELAEMEKASRNSLYLKLIPLCADSANIYSYDGRDGGFQICPYDTVAKEYIIDTSFEIPFSAAFRYARVIESRCFVSTLNYSGGPNQIHVFNTDSMTTRAFPVGDKLSFDILDDTILVYKSAGVTKYTPDGDSVGYLQFLEHSDATISASDTASRAPFGCNADNYYVYNAGMLNAFTRDGEFVKAYPFACRLVDRLETSRDYVYATYNHDVLDIQGDTVIAGRHTSAANAYFNNLGFSRSGNNNVYIEKTLWPQETRTLAYKPAQSSVPVRRDFTAAMSVYNVLGRRIARFPSSNVFGEDGWTASAHGLFLIHTRQRHGSTEVEILLKSGVDKGRF